MKFVKINDVLVFTGENEDLSKESSLIFAIENFKEGNKLELSRGPRKTWVSTIEKNEETHSYKISLNDVSLTDDVYFLDLLENEKMLASGQFQVTKGIAHSYFGLCNFELDKLWKTLVYIAGKQSEDEAAIDTLITGYVTE